MLGGEDARTPGGEKRFGLRNADSQSEVISPTSKVVGKARRRRDREVEEVDEDEPLTLLL